ncbi:hypothetical protein AVEN_129528-1 [Araneus ventricosus]|uniref:Uncharacterized protein n=1 Tax=Araneus ventricosus TaxID=182803 RepID=A0A4Y2GLF4_ARAVE|nr:hypothetical protein AVEN_129528-1 [Araneus ventricosus]
MRSALPAPLPPDWPNQLPRRSATPLAARVPHAFRDIRLQPGQTSLPIFTAPLEYIGVVDRYFRGAHIPSCDFDGAQKCFSPGSTNLPGLPLLMRRCKCGLPASFLSVPSLLHFFSTCESLSLKLNIHELSAPRKFGVPMPNPVDSAKTRRELE